MSLVWVFNSTSVNVELITTHKVRVHKYTEAVQYYGSFTCTIQQSSVSTGFPRMFSVVYKSLLELPDLYHAQVIGYYKVVSGGCSL